MHRNRENANSQRLTPRPPAARVQQDNQLNGCRKSLIIALNEKIAPKTKTDPKPPNAQKTLQIPLETEDMRMHQRELRIKSSKIFKTEPGDNQDGRTKDHNRTTGHPEENTKLGRLHTRFYSDLWTPGINKTKTSKLIS